MATEPANIADHGQKKLREDAIRALKAAGVLEEREGQEENAKAIERLARYILGRASA